MEAMIFVENSMPFLYVDCGGFLRFITHGPQKNKNNYKNNSRNDILSFKIFKNVNGNIQLR